MEPMAIACYGNIIQPEKEVPFFLFHDIVTYVSSNIIQPISKLIWLVVWNMTFIFSYIGNNDPNWLSYFSDGFKPPTSDCLGLIFVNLRFHRGCKNWRPPTEGDDSILNCGDVDSNHGDTWPIPLDGLFERYVYYFCSQLTRLYRDPLNT